MSSPPHASLHQQRRQSTTNRHLVKDEDNDLTRSLNRLSITNPSREKPSQSSKISTPLKPPSRRSSTSSSPARRLPSRSPSHGREPHGRDSRAGTPPLLRKASMNSLHSANGMGNTRTVSRRSSSNQLMSPTSKAASFGSPQPEPPKPPITANAVATDYFQAELEAHHGPESKLQTQTIVILNDAVYGHRFSRPRTSRSALSTIVERPERIKAGVLGVSAAYVRLGDRHSEGAFPVHPKRNVHTLPSIPFRIHKTSRKLPLTSQAVTNVHGTKWMDELKLMCEAAESKLAMGGRELQRPDMNRGPDSGTPERLHEGDLYLCAESLDAMEGALGAVCEAVDTVFGSGPRRAFVGVRPPGHHCSASHPSGFCWVNNVHVGIMYAALKHSLTHAAIIDFDLHHGDGSQDITWKHNARSVLASKNAAAWKKTSIGYFSVHDINSYPCEMGDEEKVKNASLCMDNAHGQTIWNVHLQSWKTEQEFWQLYETKYAVLLEKTRSYLQGQAERLRAANLPPKAAIFFSAGFDASEWESAGMQRHQVNVPTEFYARLSQDVVKIAAEAGLGVEGRVISVLEGGYSDRALFSGIFSHLSGLVADQTLVMSEQESNGLGYEMGQKIGTLCEESEVPREPSLASVHPYNPSWWSSSELDRLEDASIPPSPPRKPRTTTPPTYFSPTTASTAKVLDPVRMRRSLSGLSNGVAKPVRPASPPPPEVPWTIAAHELSRLLIPSDRQTGSCTAEDLNAEATRARRDRQSELTGQPVVAPPAVPERPTSKMSLRERKSRPIGPIDEEIDTPRARRRTDGASATTSPQKVSNRNVPPLPNGASTARRASRRLSGTSSVFNPTKDESLHPGSDSSVSRPGTSESGRPSSSMSARAQGAAKLAVKKTRTPSARKASTPKTPRGGRKTTGKAAGAIQEADATTTPAVPVDDMDKITTGMRKVKINLITPSQREAREKARLEAENSVIQSIEVPQQLDLSGSAQPLASPDVETPSTVPTYTGSVDVSPSDMAPPAAGFTTPTITSLSEASTPLKKPQPPIHATPEPRKVSAPASAPAVPQVAVQRMTDSEGFFIPFQPEGPEPVAVSQQEPLKWLPPNIPTPSANTPVATPSPVKKHGNLFQYTSGIPFAPQKSPLKGRPGSPTKASSPQKSETQPGSGSIWDIPETQQQ